VYINSILKGSDQLHAPAALLQAKSPLVLSGEEDEWVRELVWTWSVTQ